MKNPRLFGNGKTFFYNYYDFFIKLKIGYRFSNAKQSNYIYRHHLNNLSLLGTDSYTLDDDSYFQKILDMNDFFNLDSEIYYNAKKNRFRLKREFLNDI